MPLAAKAPEFSPPREDWPTTYRTSCRRSAPGRKSMSWSDIASFLSSNDIGKIPWGISRRETRGSDVSEFKQSESDSRGSLPVVRLAEGTEPFEKERGLVS